MLCHYTNEKGTDARHRLTGPRRRDTEGDWKQARESNTTSTDILMQEGQHTSVRGGQDLPQTSEVTGWRNIGLGQLNLAEKKASNRKEQVAPYLPEFQGTSANERFESNRCHD